MSDSVAASGPAPKKQKTESVQGYLEQNGVDPSVHERTSVIDRRILWKIQTEMDQRDDFLSYFLTDGTVKFPHRGNNFQLPKKFFLQNRKDCGELVLVEYAASGSGKTVDLAGSSVSRGAHLTLLMSLKDPDDFEKYKYQSDGIEETLEAWDRRVEERRNPAAFKFLCEEVKRKFERNR